MSDSAFEKEKLEKIQEKEEESIEEAENEPIFMEELMLIKQKNDELNNKIADFESIIKRQQAEFENYRKRIIKEREDYQKYAVAQVIEDLLSITDSFERALKVEIDEKNKDFIKGFDMIRHQFFDIFAKYNVVEIEGVGHAFDPSLHQAIQFVEKEDQETETVAEVFQKGYKIYDRVIRSASVKVNKPVSNDNTNDNEPADDNVNIEASEKDNPTQENEKVKK